MTTDLALLDLCGTVYDGAVAGDPIVCTRDAHPDGQKHYDDTTGFSWWQGGSSEHDD